MRSWLPEQYREQVAVFIGFLLALIGALAVAVRILAPFFAVLLLSLATYCLLYDRYNCLVRSLAGHRRTAAVLICCLLCWDRDAKT